MVLGFLREVHSEEMIVLIKYKFEFVYITLSISQMHGRINVVCLHSKICIHIHIIRT